MSRLLYQEGLTEFCLGSQKSCQAFLHSGCRDHYVQIEESQRFVLVPFCYGETRPGHLFDQGVPMMTINIYQTWCKTSFDDSSILTR